MVFPMTRCIARWTYPLGVIVPDWLHHCSLLHRDTHEPLPQ